MKFLIFSLFIISLNCWSQTELFKSNFQFSKSDLENFYSSMITDSTQIYFKANNYSVYALDKKTGKINWTYYSGNKSNNTPKSFKNIVLAQISENKIVQLNTKTGDTVQTLKISDLTTQPYFKGDIIYCATVSPEIGGAILAYDLKKNTIVWQKYIGHGVSEQPYFFQDKIVANFENNFWFEVDYNGNALDKDENCYSKNSEPPFEEHFCNIHYNLLNEYHKDVFVKNVKIEETKYHYAKNVTIILKENIIKVVNEKNKVKKEIDIDEIITLLETDVNNYATILKVEENTIWFLYENILAIYDFDKKNVLKTYDLNNWNPHQVILEENYLWLISKNDGELVGLELEADQKKTAITKDKTKSQSKINNCNTTDQKLIQVRKKELDKSTKNN